MNVPGCPEKFVIEFTAERSAERSAELFFNRERLISTAKKVYADNYPGQIVPMGEQRFALKG